MKAACIEELQSPGPYSSQGVGIRRLGLENLQRKRKQSLPAGSLCIRLKDSRLTCIGADWLLSNRPPRSIVVSCTTGAYGLIGAKQMLETFAYGVPSRTTSSFLIDACSSRTVGAQIAMESNAIFATPIVPLLQNIR